MKSLKLSPLLLAPLALILPALACNLPGTTPPTAPPAPIEPPPPAVSTTVPPTSPPGEAVAPTESPPAAPSGPFALTSTAFADGGEVPPQYTYNLPGQCSGENISPPLNWLGAPAGAQSFAVIVIDPDGGNWVHWIQFDIPADAAGLPEAVGGPEVGVKGTNDFGELGYGGPCPPSGTHKYVFTLYALDAVLALPPGATLADAEAAMQGHILGQVQLTGLRSAAG